MSLEGIPLREITEQHLEDLVAQGLEEGLTDEFKLKLEIGTPEQKKELRRDVSAFANSAGGHLFVGAKEEDRVLVGFPGVKSDDLDGDALRIEQTIQGKLRPRIPGLGVRGISLSNGRFVFVIDIDKLW